MARSTTFQTGGTVEERRDTGSYDHPNTAVQSTRTIVEAKRGTSVDKFAARWDLSPATIWREISAGRLRAARIGRRTLVLLDHEQEWIDARLAAHGDRRG